MKLNYVKVLKNLTLNELRIFLRSPGALFFALFFPLSISVFMFISSGTRGRLGPVSSVGSSFSNSALSNYEGESYGKPQGASQGGQHRESEIRESEVEEKFLKDVQIERKQDRIIVRGRDPLKVKIAAEFIRGRLYREMVREGKATIRVVEMLESGGKAETDPLSFVFVGVVVMALLSGGLFRVGQTIVFAKDGGLLRLYAATPLPKWLYGMALSFSTMLIALLQASILLGIGVGLFSINYRLDFLLVLPLILASLSFASLGFLAGGIAKTRETFFAVINLFNMFLLFFSSLFYDIYSVGGVIAKVAYIMPTSAAADSLRKIMLSDGAFFEKLISIAPQILILVGWSLVGYLLAAFTFKWTEEV